MLIKLVSIVKKIVFAFLVLYGLNLLINSFNIVIPINLFSVTTITCLGIPGLISLIIMFFIIR